MKRYFRSLFLLLLTAGGLAPVAQASHNLGGEITWECRGNGNYDFKVIYYRRCAGITPPNSVSISYPGGSFNLPQVSRTDVTPQCPSGNASRSCNGLGSTAGDAGAIERTVYEANNISLSGTPPVAGWVFEAAFPCCRPAMENTNEGNMTLRAVMYPYTPPGATQPNNLSQCYDSSPDFQQPANVVTCMGFKYVFNHLASDVDLDSLSYRFVDPWNNNSAAITFNSGYSTTAPLPDGTEDPSNGPVVLDPVSGELSFEVLVGDTGWYAQAIAIDAWRCGQRIATIVRDVPVYLIDGCPLNSAAPTAEIDTSVYTNVVRNGNTYTINTFPRDTVRFQVTSQDLIPNGLGLFPNITFEANGLQVPRQVSNYPSGTGCNGAAPCAKLISNNVPADFTNPGTNKVTFEWVPDCVHLNFGNCANKTNTYRFTLKMVDDGCPAPRVGLATVIVNVIAGDPSPVNLTCTAADSLGNVQLNWERAELDSALSFNYYRIYGASSPAGPFQVVDSITDINTLSTTLTNQPLPGYYFMVKSTGACDFISEPSDTLSTSILTVTATPAGSPDFATLSWTPFAPNYNGSYDIWIQSPVGTGTWQQIGSTTNLTYSDTVAPCDAQVAFEVRADIKGDSTCNARTTIDVERFVNNVNREVVSVDSVTIQDTALKIAFNMPSEGDVLEYILLFKDQLSGWIAVDTISVVETLPYVWQGSKADERPEEIKLIGLDSCGNESESQLALEYRAPFLQASLNTCDDLTRLNWLTYKQFPTGVAGYRVLADILDENGDTLSQNNLLFTGDASDTNYVHENLQSGYTYLYRVRAFDTTGLFTSTSNRVIVNADTNQSTKLLYISKVTNDEARDALNIQFYIDALAAAERYELQRATDRLGPYERVAVLEKPDFPPYILSFTDFGVDRRNQDYYYRVVAGNSCGLVDTVSNLARNMLLRVRPDADVKNRLAWPQYRQWLGEVDVYEIYRSFQDSNRFELVGINPGNDTTFEDDVQDLVRDNSSFCYYVKAIERNNTLGIVDASGNPMELRSPIMCATQAARLFTATAFRPGSPVAKNRTFGPNIELADLSSYRFYVLNRWGARVFETTNPEERWDGTSEAGEIAPQGTYIFYVQYATVGGKTIEEKGTFSLIR